MEFYAILLMLLPAILWLQSSVPVLNKILSAISWQFTAPNDINYIRDELARMRAFLEKAEANPETARNKSELISQIRELAYDAEDCLDEFKRLLVQPTDQEIFKHLLRRCLLLRDGAGPWFLKTCNWLLGTGAGYLFCGVVTCYFLGVACFIMISTCFLVLKISTCFWRTRLQRLGTRFLRSARTRIRSIGLVLRTSFEHDTYWLRTGVEFSTRFLRKVHAQYRIKIEAQKLKACVEQEHMREMRYIVIPRASNAGRLLEQYPSRLDAHFIEDSELIGIKESRDKLLGILRDNNKKQTCVLAVVGCGGLGKTTLVRKVFDSQRLIDGGSSVPLTCRAWITVSSSFELMGFLKKMFQKLSLDGFNPEYYAEQLILKIRSHLKGANQSGFEVLSVYKIQDWT